MKKIRKVMLVNQQSKKCLLQSHAGTNSNERDIHVHPINDPGLQSKDGQYWYLIPVSGSPIEDHLYYIINAESKQIMIQSHAGTASDENNVHTWPLEQRSSLQDKNGIIWKLDKEPTNGTNIKIKHFLSNKYLFQSHGGTNDGENNVHVWPLNANNNQMSVYDWNVNEIQEIPYPNAPVKKILSSGEAETLIRKQLKGSDFPETLNEGVTSVEMISALFVEDSKPFLEKIRTYYPLEKRTFWTKIASEINQSSQEQKITKVYRKGWSRSEEKSLSTTIGFEYTAGKEGVASKKLSFSITLGYSVTDVESGGTEERIDLVIAPRKAAAKYLKYSDLTLKDSTGVTIKGPIPLGTTDNPEALTIEIDL